MLPERAAVVGDHHFDGTPAAGLIVRLQSLWNANGVRSPACGDAGVTSESGAFAVDVPDLDGLERELQIDLASTTLLRDWADGDEWRLPELLPVRVRVRNAGGMTPMCRVWLRWRSANLGIRGLRIYSPKPDGVDVLPLPRGAVTIVVQRSPVHAGLDRPVHVTLPELGSPEDAILELEL